MKKLLALILVGIVFLFSIYYAAVYYTNYSEGTRTGELIKFSNKGVLFKTWEGEISQGISGAQIFEFSVEDQQTEVIDKLNTFQGNYVKLTYKERFGTFSWLGDSKYFIVGVEKDNSPHFGNNAPE